MADETQITVDFDAGDDALTLTSDVFVLRIAVSAQQLSRIDRALSADWSQRETVAVGTTSLGQVYWCAGETSGTAMVLVGQDDETWELALVIPATTVAAIVAFATEE